MQTDSESYQKAKLRGKTTHGWSDMKPLILLIKLKLNPNP